MERRPLEYLTIITLSTEALKRTLANLTMGSKQASQKLCHLAES